ncbi:MAG: DUF547 domain-containing protein [Xanthomonadales bacterium]|nr:DUF547 domain-containing protein [Xanthomonadales bacterium]
MLKFSAAILAAALTFTLGSCATQTPTAPGSQAAAEGVPAPANDTALDSAAVPEPFWDFDPTSNFTVDYADVDAVLKAMVVDRGRTKREKQPPTRASTGTRLSTKARRNTGNEGNRFYFEEFEDNEEYREILRMVRQNLEEIPDQVPLEQFNRDEQLAYWLNLYNITVLDQLVAIYPKRNLKKQITGKKSFFSKRILNVAGIPLSLNDIQYTILRWNYDSNPLVLYGLYQGNIGGPNIRDEAYTGAKVYEQLRDNADTFINSNRGTYMKGGDTFHVSSFYERNAAFFEDLDSHLRQHLLTFLDMPQSEQIRDAESIRPDIDDWTITDVGITSSAPQIGGSLAHNAAAMMGAVSSQQPGDSPGTTIGTSFTPDSFSAFVEDPSFSRIQPSQVNPMPTLVATEDGPMVINDGTDSRNDAGDDASGSQ